MLDKRIDDCSRAFWQNGLMTTVADARPAFAHVTDWVFDLDNTLYPRGCNLFAQIDLLISDYMVTVTGLPYAEARALQKAYYRDHGTTLHGLMLHHGVDPDRARDRLFGRRGTSGAGDGARCPARPQVHLDQW